MNVLEELQAAGWDPFNPSDECREATKMPAMLSCLSEMDRFGIYHNQLCLVLYRRFGKDTKDGDPKRLMLLRIAVLFALRHSDQKDRITPETVREWEAELDHWRATVLIPKLARMDELGPDEVWAHRGDHILGLTVAHLNVNSGAVNKERDRHLMSIGRTMYEESRRNPDPDHLVATSDAELIAFHGWLTSRGNTLARITDQGMIEIDPNLVKQWLDTMNGRELPMKGAKEVFETPMDEEFDPVLDALAAVDQVKAVRRIRDARLAEAKSQSARWHVLQNFFELLRNELSLVELAKRVSLSASALQEAFAGERAAIARALGTA
jgi:hypothetical protein